jgi:hypothetical protein
VHRLRQRLLLKGGGFLDRLGGWCYYAFTMRETLFAFRFFFSGSTGAARVGGWFDL